MSEQLTKNLTQTKQVHDKSKCEHRNKTKVHKQVFCQINIDTKDNKCITKINHADARTTE
jgi:hypothetical protein